MLWYHILLIMFTRMYVFVCLKLTNCAPIFFLISLIVRSLSLSYFFCVSVCLVRPVWMCSLLHHTRVYIIQNCLCKKISRLLTTSSWSTIFQFILY